MEGGFHPDLAVLEGRLRVILVLRERPGVDLGGQAGQVLLAGAGPGGGDQDVIGGLAAPGGKLVGPGADGQGHRLGQHDPLGQRSEHLRVGQGAAGPADVAAGRAFGDAGVVDQPGGGAVAGVVAVAPPGGERGEDPGPGRGAHRAALLQGLQASGLGAGGQGGGVQGGQLAQPVQEHLYCIAGIGGSGHLDPHLPPGLGEACPGGDTPGRSAGIDLPIFVRV